MESAPWEFPRTFFADKHSKTQPRPQILMAESSTRVHDEDFFDCLSHAKKPSDVHPTAYISVSDRLA